LLDWSTVAAFIQAVAATVMVFLTWMIIRYTKVTIEEGKKNRRKDTVERTGESILPLV
jgi:hypothetical protein